MSTFPLTCRLHVLGGHGPNLRALISSSKVRRAKVADHVDATGRLVGRRIVLSNMSDVERLEANFSTCAECKTECSLFSVR